MEILTLPLDQITPYDRNPRRNDHAVDAVAASIREFGFKVPLVIDAQGVIVTGHTRYKAAQKLGLASVPCIRADDLTPEQIRAFRLADNKVGELADWDEDLLSLELGELSELPDFDPGEFGFSLPDDGSDWFANRERDDRGTEGESEEYQEFVKKFEQKKTTDDCYTPDLVYEAVADWCAAEYGLNRADFVRPFYPGGDYQKFAYQKESIVVDNPPFSFLAAIIAYYAEKKRRFFLFGPALTIMCYCNNCTVVCCNCDITYENGANVKTSFCTNLEDNAVRARTAPSLMHAVELANRENLKRQSRAIPVYEYPENVVTGSILAGMCRRGAEFRLLARDVSFIRALDAQRAVGKSIFGAGLLISEKAAAEKAAAEKAAAEKAAAENGEVIIPEKWTLSEREWAIVRNLGSPA